MTYASHTGMDGRARRCTARMNGHPCPLESKRRTIEEKAAARGLGSLTPDERAVYDSPAGRTLTFCTSMDQRTYNRLLDMDERCQAVLEAWRAGVVPETYARKVRANSPSKLMEDLSTARTTMTKRQAEPVLGRLEHILEQAESFIHTDAHDPLRKANTNIIHAMTTGATPGGPSRDRTPDASPAGSGSETHGPVGHGVSHPRGGVNPEMLAGDVLRSYRADPDRESPDPYRRITAFERARLAIYSINEEHHLGANEVKLWIGRLHDIENGREPRRRFPHPAT